MKTPFPQTEQLLFELGTALRSEGLSPSRKTLMRAELSAYADLHHTPLTQGVPSPFSYHSAFYSLRSLYAGMAALLIVVASGGATALAAQKTLPGDTLYAVKVSVTEPLQTALIPTIAGRATWHAVLAERRLDEAATLATAQKLTPETEVALANAFTAEVSAVQEGSATLAQTNDAPQAVAIQSDLEARISAQTTLLSIATATSTDSVVPEEGTPSQGKHLLAIAASTLEHTRFDRIALERSLSPGDAAASIATQLAIATKGGEKLRGDAGSDQAIAPVAARIQSAQTALGNARVAAESKDSGAVSAEAGTAARDVEIATILLRHPTLLMKVASTTQATTTAATTMPVSPATTTATSTEASAQ